MKTRWRPRSSPKEFGCLPAIRKNSKPCSANAEKQSPRKRVSHKNSLRKRALREGPARRGRFAPPAISQGNRASLGHPTKPTRTVKTVTVAVPAKVISKAQVSAALQRIDQVVEGFAVGVVKAHQDAVRFQHLGLDHLFGLILAGQVGQAVGTAERFVDDIEDLIKTHGLQQPGD